MSRDDATATSRQAQQCQRAPDDDDERFGQHRRAQGHCQGVSKRSIRQAHGRGALAARPRQRGRPSSSAAMPVGRPRCGLAGGGAKLPCCARRGPQRDQRLGMAHGAGHAVDHRAPAGWPRERARQAGQRRAGQHDDVGAVLGDAALGQRHQALALVALHVADVGQRLVERADAGQPAVEAVGLRRSRGTRPGCAARSRRSRSAGRAGRRWPAPPRSGPVTGHGSTSRRPPRPGSPKAATITASKRAWCSAASCAAA